MCTGRGRTQVRRRIRGARVARGTTPGTSQPGTTPAQSVPATVMGPCMPNRSTLGEVTGTVLGHVQATHVAGERQEHAADAGAPTWWHPARLAA